MEKSDFIINLSKFDTKNIIDKHVNGSLTLIWRDWDNILKNTPKMVYITSVNRGEIKGPHLHTKRNSYFSCIHGNVLFVIKDNNGKYHEIVSNHDEPIIVFVPSGIPSAHINLSESTSRVLCLADIAWRPDDNEMENIVFDDYDFTKN